MLFGQSVPVSSLVAVIGTFIGGELTRYIIKEIGGGGTAQKFSTGVGWVVNLIGTAAGRSALRCCADLLQDSFFIFEQCQHCQLRYIKPEQMNQRPFQRIQP